LIKPLIDKLESIKYSPEQLGVTFIVNLDVPSLLKYVIRKKLKSKAKLNKRITYVIDENQILVSKWNLKGDDVNVFIIDDTGTIVYTHFGKITEEKVKTIFKQIHKMISNKYTDTKKEN